MFRKVNLGFAIINFLGFIDTFSVAGNNEERLRPRSLKKGNCILIEPSR